MWARLFRLPNVFSAFADILMGFFAASAVGGGYPAGAAGVLALLLVGSGMLYISGMAWTDIFAKDRRDRCRQAPLGSGRRFWQPAGS